MGGECNYLLQVEPSTGHLAFVPDAEWKSKYMMSWSEDDIGQLLADAEAMLLAGAARLRLPVQVRLGTILDSYCPRPLIAPPR